MTSTSSPTTYPPTTVNSTTTSYLPRTAPFTAPEACASYFMVDGGLSSENGSVIDISDFIGSDPTYQLYVNKSAKCFPDEVLAARNVSMSMYAMAMENYTMNEIRDKIDTVYIMAPFSCLDGWNQVYASALTTSTTTTVCCPSGYDGQIKYIDSTPTIDCVSEIEPSFGSESLAVTYGNLLQITQGSSSISFSGVVQTTTINQTMSAYGMAMTGWNIDVKETAGSSSTTTGASGSSGGLSAGAKAGIGVGVAVGVLLVVGALIFFIRSRKKSSDNEKATAELSDSSPAELQGPISQPTHELHTSTDRSETQRARPPQELQGINEWPPLELDATSGNEHGTQTESGAGRGT